MDNDGGMDVNDIDDDDTQVFQIGATVSRVNTPPLTYDDVIYHLSEMPPTFIVDDQFLVPE